jgi:uncharacterized protein YdeI (YjbR/CyaY-like superfamily)
MSRFVKETLVERELTEAYKRRPAYQQNDYVGWIMQARREETRQKRLTQMLAELAAGDTYMKMTYRGK